MSAKLKALEPIYTVKKVDGDEWYDEINALHTEGFDRSYPRNVINESHWWIITNAKQLPIAMAGLRPALAAPEGYLIRAAVAAEARGRGLQRHLIRIRERFARRIGLATLVTDTHANVRSANNLIKEGFTLFDPAAWWSDDPQTLYWRKELS